MWYFDVLSSAQLAGYRPGQYVAAYCLQRLLYTCPRPRTCWAPATGRVHTAITSIAVLAVLDGQTVPGTHCRLGTSTWAYVTLCTWRRAQIRCTYPTQRTYGSRPVQGGRGHNLLKGNRNCTGLAAQESTGNSDHACQLQRSRLSNLVHGGLRSRAMSWGRCVAWDPPLPAVDHQPHSI
jgi:hypothetical protein